MGLQLRFLGSKTLKYDELVEVLNNQRSVIDVNLREQNLHQICQSPGHGTFGLEDTRLTALVTDADVELEIPVFGLDEVGAIADFIEKTFLQPSE